MGNPTNFMTTAFGRGYGVPDVSTFVPDTVFVVMSFTADLYDSYRAIREGAAVHGLSASRADDSVGSGIILSQITKSIEDAEFVVVDLTHERPNVYYELGFTHGIGNQSADVLLVARTGTALHFDIGPMRVRFYPSTSELTEIVRTELGKMIQATRRPAQPRQLVPSGGVFSLTFQTPGGPLGGGLVVLQRGVMHGGDESYLYLGHYRVVSRESIAGELTVRHYRGPRLSILGPLSEARLTFTANQVGDRFVGEARVVGSPGLRLDLCGQWVADALGE